MFQMFIYNKSGKEGDKKKNLNHDEMAAIFSLSCTQNTEQIYRQFTQKTLNTVDPHQLPHLDILTQTKAFIHSQEV